MSIHKFSIYILLLSLVIGLSTLLPYYLPNGAVRGGEFLRYADYLNFTATNRITARHPDKMTQDGYWLWYQRVWFLFNNVFTTDKPTDFEQAAYFNTKHLAPQKYTSLSQRQAYYRWSNRYFISHPYRVKWMDAADQTVGNLILTLPKAVSWLGYSNAEIRTFVIKGNKLILDDMLPKISDLLDYTNLEHQLTKKEAFFWDAQALADEQALIQPLYKALSEESLLILTQNLNAAYGVEINLLDVGERWAFGMHLMGYLGITPAMMPEPGGCWNILNLNLPVYEAQL